MVGPKAGYSIALYPMYYETLIKLFIAKKMND